MTSPCPLIDVILPKARSLAGSRYWAAFQIFVDYLGFILVLLLAFLECIGGSVLLSFAPIRVTLVCYLVFLILRGCELFVYSFLARRWVVRPCHLFAYWWFCLWAVMILLSDFLDGNLALLQDRLSGKGLLAKCCSILFRIAWCWSWSISVSMLLLYLSGNDFIDEVWPRMSRLFPPRLVSLWLKSPAIRPNSELLLRSHDCFMDFLQATM